MKRSFLILLFLIFSPGLGLFAGNVPTNIVAKLASNLPLALVPFPSKNATKIYPVVSEKKPNYDRRLVVKVGEEPFAITAVSDNFRLIEMAVPVKPQSKEYEKRWFKVEDVLGGIAKWNWEKYSTPCQSLVYYPIDARTVDLIACLPPDTASEAFARVTIKRMPYRLLLFARDVNAGGETCAYQMALVREAPPVKTKAEYIQRAAELKSEYAYREGRRWTDDNRSLLTNEQSFGCAGFCADFAKYMFGGGLLANRGEEYRSATEIRDGDTIRICGHYFAVVFRKGSVLVTAEGNMNSSTSHSSTHYTLVDGKIIADKGTAKVDAKFEYGLHNWNPDADKTAN